jgi:glycine/sarcosine N-methyltransferase
MYKDRYQSFASRYDLFFDQPERRDSLRAEFFYQLFYQNKVQKVLDCACGTGRDLLFFHSLGLNATGSDISEAMLDQARKNFVEHSVEIPLFQVDYRELPQHFPEQFDAVVCLSTAIMEMPDETSAFQAFRSMYAVLKKGGLLVLTQGLTDKQWKQKPRFLAAINTPDFSRVFVIDYFEKRASYHILDIFHSHEIRDFKVWDIDFSLILLKDDLEGLLKHCGFNNISFYGSYTSEPYDKSMSDQLICVAIK